MINEVYGENFLSFEKIHVKLPTTGLIHIFGRVVGSDVTDSNGAGKTAILSLIRWVLFGENDRGNADDVIREGSKGGVTAWVKLVDRYGNHLLVTRYRKNKVHKNALHVCTFPHLDDLTGADNADTQRILEEQIGIDYKMFQRGFVFDGSLSIARMKDNDAKDFFEKLIGSDFSGYHAKARARLDTETQTLNGLAGTLQSAEGSHQARLDMIEELRAKEIEWAAGQAPAIAAAEATLVGLLEQTTVLGERPEAGLVVAASDVQKAEQAFKEANAAATVRAHLEAQISDLNFKIMSADKASSLCPTCGNEFSAETQAKFWAGVTAMGHQLEDLAAQLQGLPPVTTIQQQIAMYTNAQNAYSAEHLKVTQWDHAVANIKASKAATEKHIEALKHNPFPEQIKAAQQTAFTLGEKVAGLKAQRDDQQRVVENCQLMVEMFGSKGLRSFVLDMIVPALNARLGYYLGILTSNEISAVFNTTTKTGVEKFHISVKRQQGGSTYESLSQGEKSRLDLCLILALHEYLRVCVGAPLLFFDELLDGLDQTGTERVLSILKSVSQDTQVIVISHNPHVATYTDNVLTVIKENGISRIAS